MFVAQTIQNAASGNPRIEHSIVHPEVNMTANSDGDMADQHLTEGESQRVASVIDGVMPNTQYPGEDDMRNFTLLMYELHKKKFNLPDVDMRVDFAPYCTRPFPEDVIDEMQKRIDCVSDLVFALYEKRLDGRSDYLPTFSSEPGTTE